MLADDCKLASFSERILRDQIVSGINDVTMQTRLLETADLEFETAKNTAIAMEAARKDSRALGTQLPQATPVQSEESANAVKTKQQASKPTTLRETQEPARQKHHLPATQPPPHRSPYSYEGVRAHPPSPSTNRSAIHFKKLHPPIMHLPTPYKH
ncbi:hypothetical protein V5799_024746 [Amblyomma americanum]|uniref:Uncharacterized protein n=1 Tax=Amblyomma americanum TaxID=6943 RepID=A0AAQ4EB57_AMBAM